MGQRGPARLQGPAWSIGPAGLAGPIETIGPAGATGPVGPGAHPSTRKCSGKYSNIWQACPYLVVCIYIYIIYINTQISGRHARIWLCVYICQVLPYVHILESRILCTLIKNDIVVLETTLK